MGGRANRRLGRLRCWRIGSLEDLIGSKARLLARKRARPWSLIGNLLVGDLEGDLEGELEELSVRGIPKS